MSLLISMQKEGKDYYSYCGWWSVWWTGTYSMVLSKASFFHKKYLRLYTNEMPSSIKEFVTENRFFFHWLNPLLGILIQCLCLSFMCLIAPLAVWWFIRNCEDIAMSFLVANVTDAPPIWVKGNYIIVYKYLSHSFLIKSVLSFLLLLFPWIVEFCPCVFLLDSIDFLHAEKCDQKLAWQKLY